jgi:L-ascorbate metabolism protein UlaG (beta-lactamase superfamily)
VKTTRRGAAPEAAEVVSQLEPKLVVPMHYAVPGVNIKFESVERFCREMGATDVKPQSRLNVSATSLPSEPTLVLLERR